jgi:hypothetical protein
MNVRPSLVGVFTRSELATAHGMVPDLPPSPRSGTNL